MDTVRSGSSGLFRSMLTVGFTPDNWDRPQTVWTLVHLALALRFWLPSFGNYRSEDSRYAALNTSVTFEVSGVGRSTLAFSGATCEVTEDAGTLRVPVPSSTATVSYVSCTVSTADGSAVAPNDYSAVSGPALGIPVGATSASAAMPMMQWWREKSSVP